MLQTLTTFGNILAAPSEAFEDIKQKSHWGWAFVLLSLLTIIVGYFMLPLTQQLSDALLQAKIGAEKSAAALPMIHKFQYIGLLFAPVALAIKYLLIGAAVYFGIKIVQGVPPSFVTAIVIALYTDLLSVLTNIVNLLLIQMRSDDTINNITDLRAPIGLDFFIGDKAAHIPWTVFLNSLNPFAVWYVLVLGIGISVVGTLSKKKGILLAGIIWLISVLIQVASAAFSSAAGA